MQYAEFIALLLNKRIFWSSPRRPAGRPITAHLLRLATRWYHTRIINLVAALHLHRSRTLTDSG